MKSLKLKKPLLQVGDVVKVKERILYTFGQFIAKDQLIEIAYVNTYNNLYIAKAIIVDRHDVHIGVEFVSFNERDLELATVSKIMNGKEQHYPLVKAVEELQKLYQELLQECSRYHENGRMGEWQNKAEVLLETISKLKATFEIKG